MGRYLSLAMEAANLPVNRGGELARSPVSSAPVTPPTTEPEASAQRHDPSAQTNAQRVPELPEPDGAAPVAACGSPHCAGCYDVGDGKKIHPPKASAEWLAWLERWKPKGKLQ